MWKSLEQLQNRCYDSAGISTINDSTFIVNKHASNNKTSALDILANILDYHKNSINGIAHTRWATHGPKTDINSHPHLSMDNMFSIVHNGIIENYDVLKSNLIKEGYEFKSETDTEVIVNLISHLFKETENVLEAIQLTIEQLQGTWGLVIQYLDEPEKLYCTRKGSPLLVGENDKFAMVVSEQSGFCNLMDNYIILNNHDICCLELKDGKVKVSTKQTYSLQKIHNMNADLTPHPYPHWTIKEINEQIDSSLRAISLGGRLLSNNMVKLGGLQAHANILGNIQNLILLGCGTSLYAAQVGIYYMKELCEFNTIQVFDGAEFIEDDIPRKGNTALLFLSQSGETKDLHRCIQIGKQHHLFLIGVINVPDSMIAREVHCGCYLNAGREVAVASTKSFTSQVILLSMIAIWFAQIKNINSEKRKKYIKDLKKLYIDIEDTITISDYEMDKYIRSFSNQNSCFILGKGKGEAIAKEGSLKIKEISYIHAEGYSSSCLKHGPFALLKKEFPVVLLAPKNIFYYKSNNAYEEMKSRYANIIFITDDVKCKKDNSVILPENKTYADLLCVIPLQFIC